MKKRTIRKQLARAKRILKEKDKALDRWKKQRARLLELIRVTEQNLTMQGEDWVRGQVGYYKDRIAKLDSIKPK